jgi:pimeloyl-ACP methyl ester carboxylesterase
MIETNRIGGQVSRQRSFRTIETNIRLDGAGHWLPLERTKEVNAALLDFLSGLTT